MLTITFQGRTFRIQLAAEMTSLARLVSADESVTELQAVCDGNPFGAPLDRETILRSGGLIKTLG